MSSTRFLIFGSNNDGVSNFHCYCMFHTCHVLQVDEDLGFLRDQTTTTEVSIARVYNYDVKRRQAEKAKAGVAVES